jgi:hypothetical protein
MGIDVRKNQSEPIIIDIKEYDNFEMVLSQIVELFSVYVKNLSSPDVYTGHETIPFNKRYSAYQDFLCSEFENAMFEYQVSQIKEFIL